MADAVKTSHLPIPTPQELRHNFLGSDCFSVVDLNHAFHQFEMDEASKNLFVFYGPDGTLLRFNRLVMGTSSASSECHERIRQIVEGLEGVQQIKDDVVVHGKGTEHDKRLEALFQRFKGHNITLRKEKCQLGLPQVKWFGNFYSKQGMSVDPAKVGMIRGWSRPADKSVVKSFLQTVQFCQVFMRPDQTAGPRTYSDITLPLRVGVMGKRCREVGLVVPGKYYCYTKSKHIACVLSTEAAKKKKIYEHFNITLNENCHKFPYFRKMFISEEQIKEE